MNRISSLGAADPTQQGWVCLVQPRGCAHQETPARAVPAVPSPCPPRLTEQPAQESRTSQGGFWDG